MSVFIVGEQLLPDEPKLDKKICGYCHDEFKVEFDDMTLKGAPICIDCSNDAEWGISFNDADTRHRIAKIRTYSRNHLDYKARLTLVNDLLGELQMELTDDKIEQEKLDYIKTALESIQSVEL